jgi:hypothetical protein
MLAKPRGPRDDWHDAWTSAIAASGSRAERPGATARPRPELHATAPRRWSLDGRSARLRPGEAGDERRVRETVHVRFLLDTNLVEYGWRYGIGTEESTVAAIPDPPHARLARDLRALETLFSLAQRYGSLEFRVAPASLRELADSPAVDAEEVLAWARELALYAAPEDWRNESSSRRQAALFSDFVRAGDAVLIGETVRLGCSALLTCDYRLVRQGDRIRRVAGVGVMTPSGVEL